MGVDVAANFLSHENLNSFPSYRALATEILSLVMKHRRVPKDKVPCADEQCVGCGVQHLDRIVSALHRAEPVPFVLPAFPGKSPNPGKVLGPRPDMAERQSLQFLNTLCDRIKSVYSPGARIILCSDGRVFNDVVGILETDITTYQRDLSAIIQDSGASNLSTFNLDDVFGNCSFEEMRALLMTGYGETLENIQAEVKTGGDTERMYRGITRFLVEDATRPDMTISKTALQKECRRRAYEVIQRSRAWDGLLAQHFPNAVRLSIHPQVCGSRKIGIHLMDTKDEWLTAWHSVAVEVNGRFRLMKRAHAEGLGGELVIENGRPSHYVVGALPEEMQ